MASGQTLLVFTPLANQPPSASYALFATLNGQPVINFATGAISYAIFAGVMPRNYANGGITVTYYWTGDAAAGGHSAVMAGALERDNTGASVTSDSFGSNQTVTTAAPTLGQVTTSVLTFTNGAQMSSIVAGDAFRLRVERTGTSGSDTFNPGNVQLLRVEIKET